MIYSKASQLKKHTIRTKKCKNKGCGNEFIPVSRSHVCCSPYCAIKQVRNARDAKAAKEKRAALKAYRQQDKSYLMKKAQDEINKYARYRDYGKPCISCGVSYFKAQIHGGHFMAAGNNSAIKFNTYNIHAQCAQCNSSKSGNLLQYEINLREKIGDKKVEWLKSQKQTKKYDVEYLQRIIKIFTKRNKILKSRKGIL